MTKFLFGEELKREIERILREDGCRCAVAFWGSGSNKKLSPDGSYRIICNLSSGATNPYSVEKMDIKQVRQNDRLHAKVVIGKQSAVVSSANISANGLGLEADEQAHWIEAGVLVDNLRLLSEWFERLWEESREISSDDLLEAKKNWRARRRVRPTPRSFADFDPYAEETPLLYWIYRDADWEHNEQVLQGLGGDPDAGKRIIDEGLDAGADSIHDIEAMRPRRLDVSVDAGV